MSTQDTTLPPLPEWSLRDDLGGLVPSDIRSELKAYARAAIAAQAQQAQGVPAEFLPVAVSSAPHHIWLDLGFDPYEEDAHFSNLHKPTWSEDNASGNGIKYVRADLLAAAPQAEPQPEREPERKPLTDAQIEKLREQTFSTSNPFCPCDSKTMRKAVWAAERAHGIGTKGD